MKPRSTRLCALTLSALLSLGLVPQTALAQANGASPSDKDETVYVSLDPTGTVSEISVRDLLANEDKSSTLSDVSDLSDIKPSGDNVSIRSQEGNAIVWNTDGQQVQYRGTSSHELPVSCTMSFTLNGADVAAADLVDKSGHVTMRLDYKNNDAHELTLKGKQETVYTPFAVVSILGLDRDVFTNIKVSGGRVIDGADKVSVVGLSFPGLQESLALESEDVDIPSSLTIEADVERFALGQVIAIITPELLDGLDSEKFDTKELEDARNELSDAMDSLTSGANGLHDGIRQLAEGQAAFDDGVGRFAEALSVLPESAQQLAKGADGLAKASSSAAEGARELASAADSVADGISQLGTGIAQGAEGMRASGLKLQDAAVRLEAIGTSMGMDTSTSASGQAEASIDDVSAGLEAMLSSSGLSEEEREILSTAIFVLDAQQQAAQQASKQAVILTQNITIAGQDILSFLEDYTRMADGFSGAQESLNLVTQGAKGVSQGTSELASGLGRLEDGSAELSQSLAKLSDEMPQLTSGANELKQGSAQLVSVTQAILQGSSSLASGASELSEQGIKKLVDKIDESGITLLDERLEALTQAASDYQSFAGLAQGQQGTVTFFYKFDAIGE